MLDTQPTRNVFPVPPTAEVTITPTSSDESIVTVSPPSLTFNAGNWNTPQTFTVTGVSDDTDNAGEKRDATITHSVSGADYSSETATSVSVSVTDDDPDPTVSLTLDPASISENGGRSTVTATLSHASGGATTITVSANPASGSNPAETGDFTLSGNTGLTIAAGQTASTGTVTVTAVDDDDTLPERVAISATASNAEGVVAPAAAVLTITDDDAPGVTVAAADPLVVAEGANNTYTVRLNFQPGSDVVMEVRVTGSGDVTTDTAQLTFTSVNWATEQTVTVTAADDPDAVMDTATITHRIVAASSANEYDSVSVAGVNVRVTEDDTRGVTVSETERTIAESGTGNAVTYTVVLNSQPTSTVTVSPSSDDTGAARVSTGTLRFTTSNWNDPQTVTVTGVNDDIDNPADRRTAIISHRVSGGDYGGETAASVVVTVIDDDTRDILVDTEDALDGVQTTPITVDEGRTATYTIVLGSEPTAPVTISPQSSNANIATARPTSLRFTSGNWNSPQTVTVTGVNDDKDNAGEQRATTLRNAVSAPGSDYAAAFTPNITVEVTDDDPDPTVTLLASPSALVENGGPVVISATQDIVSDDRTYITVTVTAGDDTDPDEFTVAGSTLEIDAGQTTSTGFVSIQAHRDDDTAHDGVIVSAIVENAEGVNDPDDLAVPIIEEADAGVTVSATDPSPSARALPQSTRSG